MPALRLSQRLHIDKPLFYAVCVLAVISLFVMYSASNQQPNAVIGHIIRLVIGFICMSIIAQVPPEILRRWSLYVFGLGFTLLIVVLIVGVIRKGAQSWFNLGVIALQPSEIMKLGLPMLLAWYFSKTEIPPKFNQILLAIGLIVVPVILVAKQPDLGTALMIFTTGMIVLFLAGMRWSSILLLVAGISALAPTIWTHLLHDYQRLRILNVFSNQADPLGSGYHTIQSTIAVGSGGIFGKGWLSGSQVHLKFLPEPENDFIFAVFAEEFGLIGSILLITIFLFIIGRGLMIAFYAQDTYNRLLAGGLIMTLFLYFFVNIGMVIGILPVVGVPLPIISKGGSSIVTLMISLGILMSIKTHRKIVHH